MYAGNIIRHFSQFVNPSTAVSIEPSRLWLQSEGRPVVWHHPIGVIYDLHKQIGNHSTEFENIVLRLIVHLVKDFPFDQLTQLHTDDLLKSNFLYSLKEADAIRTKGKTLREMRDGDFRVLWNSLKSSNFDQYWSVSKKFQLKISNKQEVPYKIHTVMQGRML
ncbi:hypothetical protein ACOME3_003426 [Neoechinorhynchus agilis]